MTNIVKKSKRFHVELNVSIEGPAEERLIEAVTKAMNEYQEAQLHSTMASLSEQARNQAAWLSSTVNSVSPEDKKPE